MNATDAALFFSLSDKKNIQLSMKTVIFFLLVIISIGLTGCKSGNSENSIRHESNLKMKSSSYKGLIMAGYQGWFNAEGDGANRGWNHYRKGNRFEPGHCTIDFWPDMSEYAIQYKTPFYFANGEQATLFSSYDESTVDLHFKWMKEYDIDGVFIQRFVTNLKNPISYNHNQKVLVSAFESAQKYERILSIMYDLSGISAGEENLLIEDWKNIVNQFNLLTDQRVDNYLCHNGKPLVTIWGVGFNDNRKYGLAEVKKIVDFLKNDPQYGGVSVMLGVPTHWRTLKNDAQPDTMLHAIIKSADIVQPWMVGRYNEDTYPTFRQSIIEDIAWCKKNSVDYVPVVYPGFSWHNMYPEFPSNQIPRNQGKFYWKQLTGAISAGAEMIYVAMFDEIDEGTAIFKCAQNVPVGASVFVPVEEPSDFYMWLTGLAAKMLRKEIPLQTSIPSYKKE